MSRPFFRPRPFSGPQVRINGKIRAREVRVIAGDGKQLGVIPIGEALTLARTQQVDLVEVAPNATPPVCRLVDYGKFRYEQAKKDKEAKKHQHANKVKEVQLRPNIDPHDFGVKLNHAIEFLCDEMKVKITLRFRGREMAHTELGYQLINKLITTVAPYGHPDSPARLVGRSINVMLSPLPRNKRAKSPFEEGQRPSETSDVAANDEEGDEDESDSPPSKPEGADEASESSSAPREDGNPSAQRA